MRSCREEGRSPECRRTYHNAGRLTDELVLRLGTPPAIVPMASLVAALNAASAGLELSGLSRWGSGDGASEGSNKGSGSDKLHGDSMGRV